MGYQVRESPDHQIRKVLIMKFFIVAKANTGRKFTFTVNAVSANHANNKAFKHLTKTLDVMPKQIIAAKSANYYQNDYSFPEIKIK